MQLLAGSKLLEVDQSVKDWDRNLALTCWKMLAMQEDRMLFQGAQKLFGMASRLKDV